VSPEAEQTLTLGLLAGSLPLIGVIALIIPAWLRKEDRKHLMTYGL